MRLDKCSKECLSISLTIEENGLNWYNNLMLKTKTNLFLALTTAMLCALPASAAISLTANDSIAGLGTDINVSGISEKTTLFILPPYGNEIIREIEEDGNVHIAGKDLQEAGIHTVSLEQNDDLLGETEFEVLPESLDLANSAIQSENDSIDLSFEEGLEVVVILRDSYGNPLPNRSVQLISSRKDDEIQAITDETDKRGEQIFSVFVTTPGDVSLRALDILSGNVLESELRIAAVSPGSAVGGYGYQQYQNPSYGNRYAPQPQYGNRLVGNIAGRALYGQVSSFDVVERFMLDVPAQMRTNLDESITITAIDRNGQIVEDYTGTVELASTDPNAILPSFGSVTFLGSDLGRKMLILGLRFTTPGEHILYAQDSTDPGITGEAVINVQGEVPVAPAQTIEITSPEQDSLVGSLEIELEGNGPPFVNLIVTGGEEDVFGETDAAGDFSITVSLNPNQMDHTLRVRDESGQNDSGNLRLKLDTSPPEITRFTFTPLSPKEDENILIVVEAQDDSGAVDYITMSVGDREYFLDPVTATPGTYQSLFSLSEAGNYQPVLNAADSAGNITEIVGNIEVRGKDLPQVQNVQAEAKQSAAFLLWDFVSTDEPLDGYRIYVGDSPTNFIYTLDTDPTTNAATVAGLKPGATYYFAITVLQGEMESAQKSEIASVVIQGLAMEVTPGNGTLALEWTSIKEDIPLSEFMLEYGIDPNTFTEKRMINGELTNFVVRDLLNDVTYYLRLTPITTTGETLEDFVVEAEGTPTTALAGFHPGPSDPIPEGLAAKMPSEPRPPIDRLHEGAPEQPMTGIPFSKWWLAAIGLLCAGLYVRKRNRTIRATESFFQAMNTRYNE